MSTSNIDASISDLTKQKNLLRKEIRRQRRQLRPIQQKIASENLVKNLKRSNSLLAGKHIALYLGSDGEICPRKLIPLLQRWGKKAFLPVIHPLKEKKIVFCQVTPSTRFVKNRYGIAEPEFKSSKKLSAGFLSTVLMPLVAFDSKGNRMGMGGGYYDRAFAYKLTSPNNRPQLIGLAHDLQKQDQLPINDWDVALDQIITDQGCY